jgi:polyisoprenoid-binding protein YceI
MRIKSGLLPLLALGLSLAAQPTLAAWTLDGAASALSFVSVKAGDIGEVHRFDELSGRVADDGAVEVVIDLASVDTMIEIRDERMREMLFEVARFPNATFTAMVALDELLALAPGETGSLTISGDLTLKAERLSLPVEALVARLSEDRVLVATRQPVIVDAAVLGLSAGLEKLREVAGLPSISKAVPVSFVLVFERAG